MAEIENRKKILIEELRKQGYQGMESYDEVVKKLKKRGFSDAQIAKGIAVLIKTGVLKEVDI